MEGTKDTPPLRAVMAAIRALHSQIIVNYQALSVTMDDLCRRPDSGFLPSSQPAVPPMKHRVSNFEVPVQTPDPFRAADSYETDRAPVDIVSVPCLNPISPNITMDNLDCLNKITCDYWKVLSSFHAFPRLLCGDRELLSFIWLAHTDLNFHENFTSLIVAVAWVISAPVDIRTGQG